MTKCDPNAMPRPEEENKRAINILVGLPAYGGVVQVECMLAVINLIHLLDVKRIEHTVVTNSNASLVTAARNELANMAAFDVDLEGQRFSHLLFIDADSVFRAHDIWRMVEANKPIVALPFARKEVKWNQIAEAARLGIPDNLLAHFAGDPCINNSGPVPVAGLTPIDQVGTGVMLIDTTVFHGMADQRPGWKFQLYGHQTKDVSANGGNRDFGYDFFQVGIDPDTRLYFPEDFFFVTQARKLGFETYLLADAITGHLGRFEFIQNLSLLSASGICVRNILKQSPESDQPKPRSSEHAVLSKTA
jgi:hypothetical protein